MFLLLGKQLPDSMQGSLMHSGNQMSATDIQQAMGLQDTGPVLQLHLHLKCTVSQAFNLSGCCQSTRVYGTGRRGSPEDPAGDSRKLRPSPLASFSRLSHLALILCLKARPTFCAIKLMDFFILEQLNSLGADAEGYGCSN